MSDELSWFLMVVAVALPCLVVTWLIWTGRAMRAWYGDGLFGPFAVTSLPAWAVGLLLAGVAVIADVYVALLAAPVVFLAGIVLHAWVAWKDPSWAQPPWYRAERATKGATYDPQHADLLALSGPRAPHARHVARFDAGAVLLTDDPDRPTTTTTRFGREGHLWVLPDQVQFLQHASETAARGDTLDVIISVEELSDAEVLTPEPSLRAWLRLLRGDSRGRVARARLRLTSAHEAYVFHLRDPEAARNTIDALRERRQRS